MLPWASGHDYAGCTVRLSSWCPGVGICGPVLPTLMTRLHHSGLLSNKSYLITGQIYQSDVIIYTSILELSLEFKLQELLLFFYLKISCNCECKWPIDMQYNAMLQTHGAKLYFNVDGINTMFRYNWHFGTWYCECIRKS